MGFAEGIRLRASAWSVVNGGIILRPASLRPDRPQDDLLPRAPPPRRICSISRSRLQSAGARSAPCPGLARQVCSPCCPTRLSRSRSIAACCPGLAKILDRQPLSAGVCDEIRLLQISNRLSGGVCDSDRVLNVACLRSDIFRRCSCWSAQIQRRADVLGS